MPYFKLMLSLSLGILALVAGPSVSTAHDAPSCPDITEADKQRDHVVKAGEKLVIGACPVHFRTLTIENGGLIVFPQRLYVRVRTTYKNKRDAIWLKSKREFKTIMKKDTLRYNHICETARRSELRVENMYDHSDMPPYQRQQKPMTLRDYQTCLKVMPDVHVDEGTSQTFYPNRGTVLQ